MNITKYENDDAIKVDEADELIANSNDVDYAKAAQILFKVIENTPNNYVYKFINGGKLYVKFWNKNEFLHFCSFKKEVNKYKEVLWIKSAYPRAFYYLGILLPKAEAFEKSILSFNRGLELEPTNPSFLIGLGNTYSQLNNHKKAYQYYNSVGDINSYISPRMKALALRSAGVQLIEMDKLFEAKEVFLKSLTVEPNNKNAVNELLLIDEIEKGSKSKYDVSLSGQYEKKIDRCMYCRKEVKDGVIRKINNDTYFICSVCLNEEKRKIHY